MQIRIVYAYSVAKFPSLTYLILCGLFGLPYSNFEVCLCFRKLASNTFSTSYRFSMVTPLNVSTKNTRFSVRYAHDTKPFTLLSQCTCVRLIVNNYFSKTPSTWIWYPNQGSQPTSLNVANS